MLKLALTTCPRILVVMVGRNEEKFLPQSLGSVLNQTLKPSRVIVVDDRSVDRTFEMAREFALRNPRITVVKRISVSNLEHQTEIPKAFNMGLQTNTDPWDFLAKVDADIILEPNYFEEILKAFEYDIHLGIAGGQTVNEPTVAVRGGNRIIRKECWSQVSDSGLMPVFDAEDSYIDLKAKYHGWKIELVSAARSFHLRPIKQWATDKILKQRWRIGVTSYRFGYNPLLFVGRMLKLAVFERPRLVTFVPMMMGWIYAFLTHKKIEEELRRYQRRTQIIRVRRVLNEFFKFLFRTMKRILSAQL